MLSSSTFLATLLLFIVGFPAPQSEYMQSAEVSVVALTPADADATSQKLDELERKFTESDKEREELEQKLAESDKEREELEQKIGEIANYNEDLMNTVFTSLLGTVVTVTLGMLGINTIGNVILKEREKDQITKEVENSLQKLFLEWTSTITNNLQIRITWLEYELASSSATQLASQEELEQILALQEYSRAIQAVQQLHDDQGIPIQRCIIYQLEAIESLLDKMKNDSGTQVQEPDLLRLKDEYMEKNIVRLSGKLRELQKTIKDKSITRKLQKVDDLLQEQLKLSLAH